MFMEASMRYLAFPWFVYGGSSSSGGPLTFYPLPFLPSLVFIIGIVWVILGLSLIPILKMGFPSNIRAFSLLGGFFVLVLQIVIVMYGFSQTTIDIFYVQVLPIPTPALISFVIIFERYYRQRKNSTNQQWPVLGWRINMMIFIGSQPSTDPSNTGVSWLLSLGLNKGCNSTGLGLIESASISA